MWMLTSALPWHLTVLFSYHISLILLQENFSVVKSNVQFSVRILRDKIQQHLEVYYFLLRNVIWLPEKFMSGFLCTTCYWLPHHIKHSTFSSSSFFFLVSSNSSSPLSISTPGLSPQTSQISVHILIRLHGIKYYRCADGSLIFVSSINVSHELANQIFKYPHLLIPDYLICISILVCPE